MSDYTRAVRFEAAYDKRAPEPSKNYGVHGAHIWFTLQHLPTKTGLTFSISTNWNLPHVQTEMDSRPIDSRMPFLFYKPQAFGVDFHDVKPHYDGQRPREGCDVTGGVCYSDGSALLGDEFLQTLIAEGDGGLWARMERQHKEWCL